MKLIKQILIKQVITENSKKKLESKFKDEKKDLALKCEQLIFEKKKLQKEKKSATHKIKQQIQEEINNRKRKKKKKSTKHKNEQRFQVEIDNRKRKINQIDFQLEQLHQLPLGSEIVETKMESLVEVKLGMNWSNFQNETAIIIEDDIVIRIDNE